MQSALVGQLAPEEAITLSGISHLDNKNLINFIFG
jgi:hypothetical protein